MVIQMVAVGEESGTLLEQLVKSGQNSMNEAVRTTRGLQALIQPIAIIVIGFCKSAGMLILYSPIFTTVTSLGGYVVCRHSMPELMMHTRNTVLIRPRPIYPELLKASKPLIEYITCTP